ncbi:hypothetical protein T07_12904 [Trichinella nelsoni]|uniref:Uncharacterized protein n=1 Tax=Trichinella nelsoni TaxID=6336 RepID=A0A0V0S612_9BILA|nr:hypothetical protein T07_12904 [Trichinella nelsoni]
MTRRRIEAPRKEKGQQKVVAGSSPNSQCGIPRGGAEGGAVGRGGQFRNTILVSVKHANSVTLQHIPNGNGIIADAGY